MNYFMADKVLLDANFFIGWILENDSNHNKALKLTDKLFYKTKTYTNENIVHESYTVVTVRTKDLKAARLLKSKIFTKNNKNLHIKRIPAVWEEEITDLFLNQKPFKSEFLSYADCSLIVQARRQNIGTICTFDETFGQFSKEFSILP